MLLMARIGGSCGRRLVRVAAVAVITVPSGLLPLGFFVGAGTVGGPIGWGLSCCHVQPFQWANRNLNSACGDYHNGPTRGSTQSSRLIRRQVNLSAFVVEALGHLSHAGFGFSLSSGDPLPAPPAIQV
jgi:hypothetical protein